MAKLKLTPAKIAQLERYMKLGIPMKDIFAASEVSSSTYYRWMSIGQAIDENDLKYPGIPNRPTRKEGESNGKYNRRLHRYQDELKLYATLYKKMQRAAAIARIEMVLTIRSAALDGNWRAAMHFLERRDPRNWNLKTILRAMATDDERHQRQELCMGSELRDLMRILGETERRLALEREEDIRARAADDPPASAALASEL